MKNKRHISKEEILRIERAVSREMEIASGMRQCHHRVHRSSKTYTRKSKHKQGYE